MTLSWDELDDPELRPDRWTVGTALDRLDAVGDPMFPLVGREQVLPELGRLTDHSSRSRRPGDP
ncbi:hypothetical protein ACFQV8_09450 [Pseudonocardia benzenivorans]